MAKIGVIEDNIDDVIYRYSFIAKTSHEVHLVLDVPQVEPDIFAERILANRGFNLSRIHYGLDTLDSQPELTKLDLYLCDGLNCKCFDIVKRLGKDRVYILTGHEGIEKRAKEQGLHTLAEGEHINLIRLLK